MSSSTMHDMPSEPFVTSNAALSVTAPAGARARKVKADSPVDTLTADERYRAPALDKGLDILELLAQQPQGLTRGEIVKEMDRSASEIYRMLERLVARQYVMRSASGDRYALSLKLFTLAHMHPPLNRLISQAIPIMDEFSRQAEQSCHMGVYDRGNVLITAQVNGPGAWGMSIRLGARVGLLDTASGHVLMAFASPERARQMLAQHTALDGEVPITSEQLSQALQNIRELGYMARESLQSFGVADISCPVLGPDNIALAALTCPYIRRIDRHIGPDQTTVRTLLLQAAQALSFTQT
ncbi:MAG: IclR family transcriptional regulator [Burkholderiaceae bacterium]